MKIGIVEDEAIIARTLQLYLGNLGYEVVFKAFSFDTAIRKLASCKLDLVLLDIKLKGKKGGIDLAKMINEQHKIPFIFVTANSDQATIKQAKEVFPLAFLLKPFTEKDLFSSIEIAMNNYQKDNQADDEELDWIVIGTGRKKIKLNYKEICYFENNHIYIDIHLESGKRIKTRNSFSTLISQLPAKHFTRISRSHIVNHQFVNQINTYSLNIRGAELPITQKKMREDLIGKI